jgi:hypothetical protein
MQHKFVLFCLAVILGVPTAARAQQTGAILGKVVDTTGGALPGVTVEARADVLPSPRLVVTGPGGEYRFAALPPGTYTLKFELSGMQPVTRQAQVQLQLDTIVDTTMSVQAVSEVVNVVATSTYADRGTASIKSGLANEQIKNLPLGQEYRDLIKLIPGVQYTQETTRGPSAGGSGQDNVYHFDGVNVTLPLFGTLSAEPASHDIAEITTLKGGARAVDFDRAGGFSVDSVSKSGTSRFTGMVSYQFQDDAMSASLNNNSPSRYDKNLGWLTLNGGGPIVPNKAFFYGSYYRPTQTRENRANSYGPLPDYESTRDEGFGKVTLTPTTSALINGSYRYSHRLDKSDLFGSATASTAGTGNEAWLKIGTIEGSWVPDARSIVTFKYTHFVNETEGRPDNVSDAEISLEPGTRLDVNNLDTQGRLTVPTPVAGNAAYNAFVQPLIDRYGFVEDGVKKGGGLVGYGTTFDADDFYRDAGQVGYTLTLGYTVTHELHAGYQYYVDSEDLKRSSNGWGSITVPGGRLSPPSGTTQPAFYQAEFQQQTTGLVPVIHSEYRSHNLEFNDTIRMGRWTFNAGVLASNDTLYGQGLREDSRALSGYTLAPGNKYKMYEIPFSKMIQPRLGATWTYNGTDTIFGSYAKYNPAANSLPRAASWDRNVAVTINGYFDASGVLYATAPVAASSGKLFVADLTPRTVNEVLLGSARQFNNRWTGRAFWRYRKGTHFWEDTNNNARVLFEPPPDIPRELYIPDLADRIAQIGSGSTYIIADLDTSFTKFYELTLESEYRSGGTFIRGSYTWSHYYGNFDQDNTTGVSGAGNDMNTFIGSSNIADGAGRQLWNFRLGDLRGDRPHLFKVYGFRALPWSATAGAYFVAQSGQPWETMSYEPYISLTTNTNDSARHAEPAGSHRTDAHWQLDLNYTQTVRLKQRYSAQVVMDLFNVANKQTGYNIEPRVHTAGFGTPRNFFDPRRFQIAFRFLF